ncbi:putative dehydrogenase [Planomicrobium sp. HSC-17F08]|nr:putative dehydrogenase [Planomicrobium sp. HSC-17F08]
MKLGTVGTNWITGSFINAVNETAGIELAAVYSRSEQKAKHFAIQHSAAEHFTDLLEFAESERIDCVYIASPNSLHFEQAMLFLSNGKHVFCEKPIFSNIEEWEKAHQLAEEKGLFIFESMKNLHVPNLNRIKENLQEIGQVRTVFLHRNKYSSRYDELLRGEQLNIFSPDFSGGALVDLGVYPLSVAVSLFGKPEKVNYSPVMLSAGVDGSGTLVLSYPDFVCTILCSKISTSYINSEIQGEQGTISINDIGTLSTIELIDSRSKEKRSISASQSEEVMIYELGNFIRMINENNRGEYETFKQISKDVLTITEMARRQNGIFYLGEQQESNNSNK